MVHILFAVQLLWEMLSFPTVSPLLEIATPTGEQASWDILPHPSHVSEESESFTLSADKGAFHLSPGISHLSSWEHVCIPFFVLSRGAKQIVVEGI